MNGMQEQLLENYRGFYSSGPYRFYGYIDGSVDDTSNVADFSANERIIKSRILIRHLIILSLKRKSCPLDKILLRISELLLRIIITY